MPFTIAGNVVGGIYDVRLLQRDGLGEDIRKAFEIANVASGNVEAAMRVYEGVSQAGIVSANVSIETTVTGASTTTSLVGPFPKAGDMLILGFDRAHPITTNRSLVARTFAIIAPHPDIYDLADLKPDPVRGITFAAASGRKEGLGALIDFLQTALVYEHDGVKYVGGFTYRESRSGLVGANRQYDADALT